MTNDNGAGEAFVLTEVESGIGWITLNEPRRLNPVTTTRVLELNKACRVLSERDDVRVVIVTGAGRGFSSGADLDDVPPVGEGPVAGPASNSMLDAGPGLWTLTAMRQPVIAMVNGPAVGYGAELSIQADIRVAGEAAKFLLPFSELGVVSDTGAATWLLPRLVGWSKAAEILYSARVVTAEEGLRIGLYNHVVADDELRAFTRDLALSMAQKSAWSLRQLKQMLFAGLDERKAEHVLGQYVRFAQRDPDVDIAKYSAKARGGARPS